MIIIIIIRAAEDLARVLEAPLDPSLRDRLVTRREHLVDYPFEELVLFLITEPGDTLETITAAFACRLADCDTFKIEAEPIDRHSNSLQATASGLCFLAIPFLLRGHF